MGHYNIWNDSEKAIVFLLNNYNFYTLKNELRVNIWSANVILGKYLMLGKYHAADSNTSCTQGIHEHNSIPNMYTDVTYAIIHTPMGSSHAGHARLYE